ncbi:hypothetical protein [Barrientosiimonas humi]|uniref:hypothetical protein n=1 Tax=Barrientosiimonas humi TaxID=999931 RepID=UPI00370D1821
MRRRRALSLVLLAVVSAAVILGPALSAGLVQAYDLGWSPDPRFTPAVLGLDTPAPRVVPSDAAGVLLGRLLGAGLAQKVVLLSILVLASMGVVRLVGALRERPSGAALAAAVLAAQWNPFVAERLVIGQWTVLLGYSLVPWVLAMTLDQRRDGFLTLTWPVLLASIGGANSAAMVALAAVPALAWQRAWRGLAGMVVLTIGAAAIWALPSLTGGAAGDPAGADAFAARSDSPFGLVASLLSGGGFWNVSSWPVERASVVLAGLLLLGIGGAVLSLARGTEAGPLRVLLVASLPSLLVTALSSWSLTADAWGGLLDLLPGGGILRDSQKLVAPWVCVIAAGAAVGVDVLRRWGRGAAVAAWAVPVLPVLLLPSMAWGFGGRLDAVRVPTDLRSAATLLSEAPQGEVGLLPWNQYRRYAWNGDRISLSIVPRMVDAPVLRDDSLPLRDRRIGGENARAAAVTQRIAAGVAPTTALREQGVRYLVIERATGLVTPPAPTGARILASGPHVTVVDLGPAAAARSTEQRGARGAGVVLTGLTWAVGLAAAWVRARRRRLREGGTSTSYGAV